MRGYLKSDIIRVFYNYKIYVASICIMIVMNFAIEGRRNDYKSVLVAFHTVATSKYMLVVFVISASIFSCCLVDDLETEYFRYQVVRGSLNEYIFSKIFMVFISTVLSITVGVILFVLINSLFMPVTENASFDGNYVQYDFLYNKKFIMVWFGVWGIKFGCLAGILSIAAMLSSLFITNKMFVLAMPALLYQLILEISTELDKLNIVAYDIAWYRIDWAISNPLSRMRGVLFTIICITMMTEAISYKLKRRV